MKNVSFLALAFIIFSAFSNTHTEEFKVDPTKSKLEWVAEKVTGGHNGYVSVKSGSVLMDHGKIAKASFSIDMTSITNVDIESEKYREKLIDHLKSEDFFEVDKHPEVTFKMIRSNSLAKNKYNVLAELTIKGNKNVISFPLELTQSGSELNCKGTFKFDRTKYDIIYGSGTFFDNLGDKAIDNEVVVNFDLFLSK
ncbi:MAG: YceI family protein [Bacteroidota bacterium]|nr:YceI family protein [Bacteroidota bacterium]